jgi:hypothetical protein
LISMWWIPLGVRGKVVERWVCQCGAEYYGGFDKVGDYRVERQRWLDRHSDAGHGPCWPTRYAPITLRR